MQIDSYQSKDNNIPDLNRLIAIVNESELSSIKKIVSELIRMINDPKSSAGDLKEVIKLDPPLTGKLLKLANSAYYGYSRYISTIQDAVVCVGFNQLKELALNQKIGQIFDQNEMFAGYSRALLWKHCVAVAICGKLIYKNGFGENGGNAYVAGLLHDIGIVVEDHFLLNYFLTILDEVKSAETGFNEVENKVLGYDHTNIGYSVVMDWNFPEEIAAAIRYHHNPEKIDQEEFAKLTYTIYVADSICQSVNIGFADAGAARETSAMQYHIDKLNKIAGVKLEKKFFDDTGNEVGDNIVKMEKAGWF